MRAATVEANVCIIHSGAHPPATQKWTLGGLPSCACPLAPPPSSMIYNISFHPPCLTTYPWFWSACQDIKRQRAVCLCVYVYVWVFGVCFMCGHISVRRMCSKQQYIGCSQVTKKPRATAPCQWMSPIYPTNQPTHHPTKLINQPNLSIYPTNQPANSSTNLTYRPTKLIKQPSDQPTNQLINQPNLLT